MCGCERLLSIESQGSPGVHSLERTAQEDMLLVLFNAAISNLIMFRNNFALNRNVANMFTVRESPFLAPANVLIKFSRAFKRRLVSLILRITQTSSKGS